MMKCYCDKFAKIMPNEKHSLEQIRNADENHGTGAKFLTTLVMTTERTATGDTNGKSYSWVCQRLNK